jgi:tetratricopeptide (TPR) repeat protein
LARLVLGDAKVARSAVGDELSPDIAAKSQSDRLRKQLYDLQTDVGPELGQLIRRNRTHVWLELDGTDSDIERLRDLANRSRQREHIITAEQASEIRQMLDQTGSQDFLAGFEELERKVTRGRGTAGEVVRGARLQIAGQRAELVCALAEYQDALGHPEAAIPYLQSALDALQDRQDLARLLVVAYLKTGQTTRASELRRQFPLKQE